MVTWRSLLICKLYCLCSGHGPQCSRSLAPGVFKLSCSTPFTPFLRLISAYRPFQLYLIPKTLSTMTVFSSVLAADFCLTGHSPVFAFITALLYIVLLALCGRLQTQRVGRALHPVSGEDGWLRSPGGSNTLRRPGLLLDGWLGWPDPVNRLVVFCPNFD